MMCSAKNDPWCSDCLDVPVIVDLTSSIAFARFLFVGVFVISVVFLGLVTFCNTMDCPPVLHIIVCLLGRQSSAFF